MNDALDEALAALKRGEQVVLATIINAKGSTPLPAGARMLVGPKGRLICGSVGGGTLEARVVAQCDVLLREERSTALLRFELTEEDASLGSVCGGSVEVLAERLHSTDRELLMKLWLVRAEGETGILVRHLNAGGDVETRIAGGADELAEKGGREIEAVLNNARITAEALRQAIRKGVHREQMVRIPAPAGEVIVDPAPGTRRLILFGAGHVGVHLCPLAANVGFAVDVVDPRPEVLTNSRFGDAAHLVEKEYVEAFNELNIRPSASVVIVTPGHRSDEAVLERALKTDAGYIGMIGSAKKVDFCFGNLKKRGVTEEQLARVHAPVGLNIGAITAEEIAVSIVAELIRHWRRSTAAPESLRERRREG